MNRPVVRAGFSLLELMVVLTILSVVSTIGVTGFFRMTGYWNDLEGTLRLNKVITQAFASLQNDFENVLAGSAGGIALQGFHDATEDNVNQWRLVFEDDSIILPVEMLNPLSERREQLAVKYGIERGNGSSRLVRTALLLDDETGTTGTRVVVADHITGMCIQYFDGAEWREHWDSSKLPRLVRISLLAIDNARPDRQIARVATFSIKVGA